MNYYDLTNPQKSIWSMEEFYKGSNINNICGTLTIKEAIDLDRLNKAVNIFIQNNKSFGLRIVEKSGKIQQYFSKEEYLEFEKVNLKDEKALDDFAKETGEYVFDVYGNRLYKFILFKLDNRYGGFVILTHHLISDAATFGLIGTEIAENYYKLGMAEEIPSKDFSYEDYIETEKEYMESPKFVKAKEYWEGIYSDVPEVSSLPSCYKNETKEYSIRANRKEFFIDKELFRKISELCAKYKLSNFNFFMAIFATYISKITNLNDFSIGTPILNRTGFKEKHTTGMFINAAALRIKIDENVSFTDFAKDIAESSLGMLRHQKYPYEMLLENLRKKDNNLPNLYDVMLSYQITKAHDKDLALPYEVKWYPTSSVSTSLNIHLHDNNDEESLNIAYDYKIDKYDEKDIEDMHSRILHLINQVLKNENILEKDLEIVTEEEKDILLNKFNNTDVVYPKDKTVSQLFEEQLASNPEKIAVVFEDKRLTYKELNEKANSLAIELAKNKLSVGDTIGIRLERSLELIISIFACIKSGITYVLIEKNLPNERIQYILENSDSKLLLTSKTLNSEDFNIKTLLVDNCIKQMSAIYSSHENASNNPNLCIIYTSGSTGAPKGVLLKQSGFINLVFAMNAAMNLQICDRFISHASVSFDMFAFELYCSLLNGKTLYLTNDSEQKDSISISNIIKKGNIDFILSTPSKIELLLANDNLAKCLSNIKVFLLGGEVFTSNLYNRMRAKTAGNIYNGYGPTEITACCSIKKVDNEDNINIGKPVNNAQIYILDNNLSLCPIGHTGELCVAGHGLASCYINNKERTDKAFVKFPSINRIVYRTGDLARFNSNGEIEYIGRHDFQVKLHGQRIELEEIERKIAQIEAINNICVCIKELNRREMLCAYYTINKDITKKEIKEELAKTLPQYMIPTYFLELDELPLTQNGKINRAELPDPVLKSDEEIVRPINDTEEQLLEIFSDMLGLEKISTTDSFFELGGDSLLAINLTVRIHEKFKVRVLVQTIFENPTISELSNFILHLDSSYEDVSSVVKVKEKEFYHLSSAQRRIYYASKIAGEDTTLYNMPGAIILEKKPDIQKLNKCFETLISRHSNLRTYFEVIDDEVYQKVLKTVPFEIEEFSKEDKSVEEIMSDFIKPFNLAKAPLFRAALVTHQNKYVLLFDMHHIIGDGTSFSIFITELEKLYNGGTLPDSSLDYIDFAEWEFERLTKDSMKQNRDFWLNQFKTNIPVLDLPTDYVRPSIQSFEGAKIYKTIDLELSQEINSLAKELDVSTFMLLLSFFYILLFKYSSQEDIVCGTPSACRDREELLNMLGMFVNTLPLKNHIDDSMNFKDFLNVVKTNCIKAFDHQSYPFDELVINLDIEKDTSRNPLFQVMFIYQNNGLAPISFDGTKAAMYIPDTGISKFDLSLEVIPRENNTFSFTFEYCTKLFKSETIERLSCNFINIIKRVLDNPDQKISDIDILSEEEKNKILCEFNNTKMDYPKNKTIIQMFEEQVQKTPENIAIVFENQKLTYKELNEKANHLAWYLRNSGFGSNDIISIMVNRSLELLVAIIAVLKSGACYIPIDPSYPKDRTEYMLKNSNSKLLLTSSTLFDKIDFDNKIAVNLTENYFIDNNNNLPSINEPDDTSYIIYTSGSTGLPKGVVLKHQSLTNLTYHLNDYVEFLKADNYIAMASVTTASFDIFIFESLIALQKGLKVVIANEEEQRLPSRLNSLIGNNDIKAIQMTPSRMRIFVDNLEECPNLSNLDYVVLAGEPLPDSLLKDLLALGVNKVYNGYGPSETTVFSTFTDVTDYDTVNIGRPLSNTQMYILDKNLSPVPIGIPGELYIAGDGVGKGYLNNEKITNERFIKNPFNQGSLMYKTGDVCKFLDNGEIVYIERADNQVKIRGLRIELEEIEAKLLEIPAIKKAKVVKQTIKNRDFISAYYIGDKNLNQKELRKILSASLPNYMVPSYFTELDDFPYTPNGKIDKNALPLPNSLVTTQSNSYIAPRNDIEMKLAKLLENILHTSPIGISDDFYSLGGDSLTTIALCTRVKQTFNTEISFKDVMLNPTIEELGAVIANAEISNKKTPAIEKCEVKEYYPASSAQKRTYLASHMNANSTLYNISGSILLNTIPDIKRLQSAISVVASRHEPLRTYFEVVNGQIVQKIANNLNIKLNIQDVNTNDPDELLFIYQSIFDLNKAPLFNVVLFKLPNGKALLMLDIHHIIFDGTSLNNFIQELSAVYNGNDLPELDISYKDFAVWENNKLNSDGFDSSRKFWCEQFSDYIPVLNLPTVFPRPEIKSYEGKVYNTSLSNWFVEKINAISSNYKVTPYMVLLSSYYILLNKYSNNEDIVVGSPASGRLYKELEPLLGMFVNSIPLRNTVSPSMSFEELLQEVKSTCINAFAHQDYPFDILVNDLKIPKDSTRSLLFDTMFIFQNSGVDSIDFGGIKGAFVPPTNNSAKFDISLEVLPDKDALLLSFEYCTKLFDEIFIGNFAKAYENILTAVLENPKTLISNISITKNNQSNKLQYKFNKIDLDSKENVSLFEKEIDKPNFEFSENNNSSQALRDANINSDFTNFAYYDTISEGDYSIDYMPPRNKIETQVASAFESLLSLSHVSIDDNFFELGGDSLVAINLQIELMKQNLNVTYADIFANPTIRTLSAKLCADESSSINTTNVDEFSEINKILENTINMPNKIDPQEIGDILLTGATGFLGIHILENFLKNKNGKAYCLVRPSKTHTPVERFRDKLHYYFGTKYDELIGDRIIIISSDISKENFGLSDTDLLAVASHVSCVINSAAKVAHFGNYSSFEKINVYGTKNLLDFCLKFNKRFYQISTLSVSGNTVVDQSFENDVIFRENNLYIGQALDNVYVRSKFEAEKLVLKYISKGLNGYILRVGNLMNRYSDAKFQPNVQENAYVSMLASLLNIRCIPEYLLERYMEFTPVDSCADAIIKIIEHPYIENKIFHLYDYNHVDIGDFIDIVKHRTAFDIVSSDEFVDKINQILKKDNAESLLAGILRDLDSNKRLTFETKIKIKSEFSIEYLQKIGFVWPKIDEEYLNKFLDYFESIGYMNFKED